MNYAWWFLLIQWLYFTEFSLQAVIKNFQHLFNWLFFLVFFEFPVGSFTFLPFAWYILGHFSSNYFFWICFTEISLYWDVTGMMSLGAICTTSLKCGELSTHSMVIVFSCVDIGFPWESIVAEKYTDMDLVSILIAYL